MIELIDKKEVLKIIDESGDLGEAHGSINYNCNPILTIPSNPTNGDMIKALYPSVVIRVVTDSQIGISFFNDQSEITWIPMDWWRAPYREENNDAKH